MLCTTKCNTKPRRALKMLNSLLGSSPTNCIKASIHADWCFFLSPSISAVLNSSIYETIVLYLERLYHICENYAPRNATRKKAPTGLLALQGVYGGGYMKSALSELCCHIRHYQSLCFFTNCETFEITHKSCMVVLFFKRSRKSIKCIGSDVCTNFHVFAF